MTNILAQIIVTLATNYVDLPNATPPIRFAYIERRQEVVIQLQGGEFNGRIIREVLQKDYVREGWLEPKPLAPLLSTVETIKPTLPQFDIKPILPPLAEATPDNFEPVDGTKPIVPRATELEAKP